MLVNHHDFKDIDQLGTNFSSASAIYQPLLTRPLSSFQLLTDRGLLSTGVCSYVQKHVIDALEGFSQFLANEVSCPKTCY